MRDYLKTAIQSALPILILFPTRVLAYTDQSGCGSYADLTATIAEISQFLLAIISILFMVSFVMDIVQAQVAYGTGDPRGYAHAVQALLASVFLLSVAFSAQPIADSVSGYICEGATSAAAATKVWYEIAKIFISMLVAAGTGYTLVFLVSSLVKGQIEQQMGMPSAMAQSISKVVYGIFGLIIIIGSVGFGSAIINIVSGN